MCFLHFLVTYQGSLFRGSMSHNFAPQEITRVWKNVNFEENQQNPILLGAWGGFGSVGVGHVRRESVRSVE